VDLCGQGRDFGRKIDTANKDAAAYYDNQKHRDSARQILEEVSKKLSQLIDNLSGPPREMETNRPTSDPVPLITDEPPRLTSEPKDKGK
jgi:hypothetical protein